MELHQIVEDLLCAQIKLSEGPLAGADDLLAFVQKGLPHFHQLAACQNILTIGDACRDAADILLRKYGHAAG